MTTVTTVGYGDHYPVTPIGRAVAVVLMLTGVALLGVITASIAAWFVALTNPSAENEEGTELTALRAELAAVRGQLERISEQLTSRTAPVSEQSGVATARDRQ